MAPSPSRLRRLRLVISYDGTDFCGWQRQKSVPSVQEEIERALSRITCETTTLHGAGRTDAGVHALGMNAHFDTGSRISPEDLQRGMNSLLPPSIRIYGVNEVSPDFHSRFSALAKEYRYSIFTGKTLPPLERYSRLQVVADLDLTVIRDCLQLLKGTHDFESFENSGTRDRNHSRKGAVRTLFAASLREVRRDYLELVFLGDGFLKNMVRNMVGTLLEVGRGKIGSDRFSAILGAADRCAGGPTVPPQGLSLVKVYYEEDLPLLRQRITELEGVMPAEGFPKRC